MSPYLKFLAKSMIIKNLISDNPAYLVAHVRSSFLGDIDKILPKGKDNIEIVVAGNIEHDLKKEVPKPLLIKALVDLGIPQTMLAEWFKISEQAISQNKNKAADDPKYETFCNTPGYKYFMDKLYDPKDSDLHIPIELKRQRIRIELIS